uniref:Uncharacterized protein n=1 Tax=Helianthus annuus TaxID=4232 RepID=A0A251TUA9_HELAN
MLTPKKPLDFCNNKAGEQMAICKRRCGFFLWCPVFLISCFKSADFTLGQRGLLGVEKCCVVLTTKMKLLIWTLAPQPGIAFGVLHVQFSHSQGCFHIIHDPGGG